jgi:hypothetical protein
MLFLPFPLTAGDPHGRNLAGPEPPPPAMAVGLDCSDCFLSRGFSIKPRDQSVIKVIVISCECMFCLAKFITIHRKFEKWQN